MMIFIVALRTYGHHDAASELRRPGAAHQSSSHTASQANLLAVDEAVRDGIQNAREDARTHATRLLELWVGRHITRSDSFLDQHLSWMNDQALGIEGMWHGFRHWWDPTRPTPAELQVVEFTEEFADQVLRPDAAERELWAIRDAVQHRYLGKLQAVVVAIPDRLQLPNFDTSPYLSAIGALGSRVQAGRSTPLPVKLVIGATLITGASLAVRATALFLPPVVTVVASAAGAVIGTPVLAGAAQVIVGVGIVALDVAHHHEAAAERHRLLLREITNSLERLAREVLSDTMTQIDELERIVVSRSAVLAAAVTH